MTPPRTTWKRRMRRRRSSDCWGCASLRRPPRGSAGPAVPMPPPPPSLRRGHDTAGCVDPPDPRRTAARSAAGRARVASAHGAHSHDSRSTTGSGWSGWTGRPPTRSTCRWVSICRRAIAEASSAMTSGPRGVGRSTIFAAGADVKAMADWGPDEVRPASTPSAPRATCSRRAHDLDRRDQRLRAGWRHGTRARRRSTSGRRRRASRPTRDPARRDPGRRRHPAAHEAARSRAGRRSWCTPVARSVRQEAISLGLATRIEPAGELLEAAVRDARAFANGPRHALAAAKAAIAAATTEPGSTGIARERALFWRCSAATTSAKGCGPSSRNDLPVRTADVAGPPRPSFPSASPGEAMHRVRVVHIGMNRVPRSFEVRADGPDPFSPKRVRRKDVSDVAEERYRGASVRPLPQPNKQYTTGRTCAEPGCETRLSRYNKWQYCWQHEPVHAYVPRGKRKSRNQAA